MYAHTHAHTYILISACRFARWLTLLCPICVFRSTYERRERQLSPGGGAR